MRRMRFLPEGMLKLAIDGLPLAPLPEAVAVWVLRCWTWAASVPSASSKPTSNAITRRSEEAAAVKAIFLFNLFTFNTINNYSSRRSRVRVNGERLRQFVDFNERGPGAGLPAPVGVDWQSGHPAPYAARMLAQSDLASPSGTRSGEVNCWGRDAGASRFAGLLVIVIFRDARRSGTAEMRAAQMGPLRQKGVQARGEDEATRTAGLLEAKTAPAQAGRPRRTRKRATGAPDRR